MEKCKQILRSEKLQPCTNHFTQTQGGAQPTPLSMLPVINICEQREVVLDNTTETQIWKLSTWENGKKTHQSKSCVGSCGNRDAVTGQRAGFHPFAHSGQSWTFAPH